LAIDPAQVSGHYVMIYRCFKGYEHYANMMASFRRLLFKGRCMTWWFLICWNLVLEQTLWMRSDYN